MRQNQITRWAWWGRTSTEDLQDPTLSLPRQLSNSHPALPPGAVIVAHFYDIESGRKDLAQCGHGHAHEQFDIPIPRDGGIQDLDLAIKEDPALEAAGLLVLGDVPASFVIVLCVSSL